MAQIYKFFNAVEVEPGVFDREYQASDFADFFGTILSSGLIHTDEIPGMQVYVEPGTLRTHVTPGKAIVKGQPYENTANEYLEHSLPESSMDRIDRIVLRLDLRNSERNILLHIKEGAPSTSPIAPELQRDNFIHELSLAHIRVRANTSSLQAEDLIDERLDEGLCGLVNSMLTIPTSQFLSEWNSFMDDIRSQSPASQGELEALENKVDEHQAEFVQQLGENGYQKLPNGLILQWGAFIMTGTGAISVSSQITFPIEFPNKCFFVSPTNISRIDPPAYSLVPTNTGFTAYLQRNDGSPIIAGQGSNIVYFAIGY